MTSVLLVVREAYDVRGGVELAPRIVAPDERGPLGVTLFFPDGSSRDTRAELVVAHVSGPRAPFALVRLPGLTAAEVPAGTEVRIAPK